jgi:serine protease Do
MTPDVANSLHVRPSKGVLVAAVDEDGPGKAVGILPGDVILKFDGKEVNTVTDLPQIVSQVTPGKITEVIFVRDAKEKKAAITVGVLGKKN